MATDTPHSDQSGMESAQLRALLDAAVDAIIVIDDEGVIQSFNAAAERMFGYPAGEAIGRSVQMLMPEPDRTLHDSYVRRYLDTRVPHVIGAGRDVLGRRANGEIFPLNLSVGEARAAGGTRFVGILRDLTSRHAAEQRSRSLEARLAHVDRFNLMGEMAAGIAHEINQPLSAIAAYAQAAKRIIAAERLGTHALMDVCEKIDEQALRAGRVIEHLRKFIRKQETRNETVDVNRVVADVANLIEADARAEGIRVTIRYGDALPNLHANSIQLQQVLLNLTRNSVDAMRQPGGGEREVSIATERTERGGVRICVADHGPGVSRQLGDSVFDPFVTTKRDGLGVGLAISRTIIQSYGGNLSYRDNPTGGAIFVVELPPLRQEAESGESQPH
jgi:two-component system sensor kinase FixL